MDLGENLQFLNIYVSLLEGFFSGMSPVVNKEGGLLLEQLATNLAWVLTRHVVFHVPLQP